MNSQKILLLLTLIIISNINWSQTSFYPGDTPAFQACSDCNGNITNTWSLNSTNVFNYNATANYTNSHISSDFGPRYIVDNNGNIVWNWHSALDYNPLGQNADAGYAITAVDGGTIDNITSVTGIKQIRIADWVYIHIFTNAAAPSVRKTQACTITGTNTFYYDSFRMGNFCLTHTQTGNVAIAIIESALNSVWLSPNDNNFTFNPLTGVCQTARSSNTVNAQDDIAPIGLSGTSNVHLHLGRGAAGSLYDPLEDVSHPITEYWFKITDNQVSSPAEPGFQVPTFDYFSNPNKEQSLRVATIMFGAQDGFTYADHAMNINRVEIEMKSEHDNEYKHIIGPSLESRIDLGNRNGGSRYPSFVRREGNLATANTSGSTGVRGYAYNNHNHDEFFFSDINMRSLGSDNKKICNVPSECRYNDGNYTVRAKGYDIRGNLRTSQLNSEEEMVLDNFMPYVKSVDVFVDACQIYKLERTEISSTSQNNAKLKQNTANFIKRLDPNGEDINFTITVSEPMEELKLRYEVNGVPAIQTLIGTANNMTWTGSINGISSLDDLTVSMFGKDRAGNRLLNVAASTMNVKESTITLAYRKQRDSGSPSNDWVNYNSVLFDSPTTLEEFDHIILNFGPNECSAGLKGDNEDTNLRSICGDPDCEILLEVNQHACGYSVDLGFDNPNSLYTIKWTDENGNEIKELEGLTRFEAEENGLYCFEITLGLDCCSTEGCVRVNVLIPPIYFRDDNTLNDGFTTTTLDLFDFISLAECIKVDIIRSSDRILIHSCTDPSRIELDLEIGEEYCMKISDCNDASCFYTHCFTVEGETCPGIIDINQRQLVPSCNTENTGTISIDAQSNCNPVSIKWSNGDTGNTISELSAGTYCATVTVGDPECNDITGLSCKAVKCFKVRERTCDCEDNPGMPSITQRQVCRWVYPEFGDPFIVWTVQVIVDVSDRGYCITLDGMNPTSSLFDYTRERIIYTFDTGGELCYTIVDKCTLFEYSDCIDLVIDPERPCYIYPPDIPIEVTDRFTTNDPDVINFTTINEIESYTHKFELISTIDSTPIELDRSEYMFGNELYDSEILPKKIELNTSEDFEIKAFPNPFSDLLTVEIFIQNEPTDVELNVSSIDGKNMISLKRKSIAGKTNIELPEAYELKSGLYYLSIIVNDKVRTIPIVKI